MDRRVAIEYKAVTQDPTYGTPIITWTNLATVWAEWRDELPSKDESERLGLEVEKSQTRLRIRYRADVTSAMRIVYDSVNYQIVGGPATLGRKEFTELMVERYSS